MNKLILIIILLLGLNITSYAQNTKEKPVKIELKNGDVRNGVYKSQDEYAVFIYDEDGNVLTFEKNNIVKMEYADETEKQDFMDQYYFLSSNHPIGKGNSYYKNQNLFINQFNFGVSDNFSIGVGFETISLLVAGEFPPITYVNPRFTFGGDKVRFGLNAFLIIVPYDGVEIGGILTPSVTFGSRTSNISVGIGSGFTTDDFGDGVVFTVAGTTKISNKVSFVGESYIASTDNDNIVIGNIGVRIKAGRLAIDASLLFGLIDDGGFSNDGGTIPVLGLSVPL
jgi:sRNA-binding regulator protein Hfq